MKKYLFRKPIYIVMGLRDISTIRKLAYVTNSNTTNLHWQIRRLNKLGIVNVDKEDGVCKVTLSKKGTKLEKLIRTVNDSLAVVA